MNLEHHRRGAERLVRRVAGGDPDACARVRAALGPQGDARFALADARRVIASERGFASWEALEAALREEAPPRRERTVDSGLCYRPRDPVRVRVLRRGLRISVSDDGAAVARAGRPPGWRGAARQVERELANVSRQGVVSLPVVPVGPGEEAVVCQVAETSLDLYRAILDIEAG
ncbi:MAG TPA: hypothetical protein VHX88_12620 [Solirubrobacteraceae bacterium]|jgi:hypothetical protein|nr:hypothetical protein [Solirubrobacteraceae bacterium]